MSGLNLRDPQLDHATRIIAAVRRRGLSRRHAVIALEAALTESMLWMYASHDNPDSLRLPHDVVGNDHGSVGLFAQRVGAAATGPADPATTQELMDVDLSTARFLAELAHTDLGGLANWEAAQAVQHSPYADGSTYRVNDAWANRIVDQLWPDRGSGAAPAAPWVPRAMAAIRGRGADQARAVR